MVLRQGGNGDCAQSTAATRKTSLQKMQSLGNPGETSRWVMVLCQGGNGDCAPLTKQRAAPGHAQAEAALPRVPQGVSTVQVGKNWGGGGVRKAPPSPRSSKPARSFETGSGAHHWPSHQSRRPANSNFRTTAPPQWSERRAPCYALPSMSDLKSRVINDLHAGRCPHHDRPGA
jgi:hypothetical protein